MAKTSAPEAELGSLHARIARVMSKVLTNYEKAQDAFTELMEAGADAEQLLEMPEVSPAMLSVITKFLSDNKITAAAEDSKETSELAQQLQSRQARREARNGTNVIPMPTHG
jgi:hypothetical protein